MNATYRWFQRRTEPSTIFPGEPCFTRNHLEHTMSNKTFKLSADQIKPLVPSMGSCIATDMITVDGYPVGFMYREEPTDRFDSGWRFMSGLEEQEYMDNPGNLEMYDVNTIANYDPGIMACLDAPIGCAFERDAVTGEFSLVEAPDAQSKERDS